MKLTGSFFASFGSLYDIATRDYVHVGSIRPKKRRRNGVSNEFNPSSQDQSKSGPSERTQCAAR
jgi:hypothetical protein